MSKYTFTSDWVPDQLDRSNRAVKVTHEFEADTIEEVCAQFEDFLRGAGFHFDGHLDIIDDYLHEDVEEKEEWVPLTNADTKNIPASANLEVKGKFYVDPPGGWKYGFPAEYDETKDGTMEDFFRFKGYPEQDIEFAIKNYRSWDTKGNSEP